MADVGVFRRLTTDVRLASFLQQELYNLDPLRWSMPKEERLGLKSFFSELYESVRDILNYDFGFDDRDMAAFEYTIRAAAEPVVPSPSRSHPKRKQPEKPKPESKRAVKHQKVETSAASSSHPIAFEIPMKMANEFDTKESASRPVLYSSSSSSLSAAAPPVKKVAAITAVSSSSATVASYPASSSMALKPKQDRGFRRTSTVPGGNLMFANEQKKSRQEECEPATIEIDLTKDADNPTTTEVKPKKPLGLLSLKVNSTAPRGGMASIVAANKERVGKLLAETAKDRSNIVEGYMQSEDDDDMKD